MFKLSSVWPALKSLRRHPDPEISIRTRTIGRNKTRLDATPDDPALQARAKKNLEDIGAEIAKRAH